MCLVFVFTPKPLKRALKMPTCVFTTGKKVSTLNQVQNEPVEDSRVMLGLANDGSTMFSLHKNVKTGKSSHCCFYSE